MSCLDADEAACARPVLHDDRLAEHLGEPHAEGPRGDVSGATGRERDDHAHRALGIRRLSHGDAYRRRERHGDEDRGERLHVAPPDHCTGSVTTPPAPSLRIAASS